ncbi:hypothetical protein TWF696_008624 [Orbilia brochopaga]|uniref:Uncharacterized protein n=1 Tax=Orbilia brochopaga TaxID=3140254 RepID=A0AAV9UHF7_9PEZI
MPRRGIFKRGRLSGLFDAPAAQQSCQPNLVAAAPPVPAQNMGAIQPLAAAPTLPLVMGPGSRIPDAALQPLIPAPEVAGAWPNVADIWPDAAPAPPENIPDQAAINAWLREGLLEPQDQPGEHVAAEPMAPALPAAAFQNLLTPWEPRESRGFLSRMFHHIFGPSEALPVDFHAPPPEKLTWDEVRERMPPAPPPRNPAADAEFWHNVRLRMGAWPIGHPPRWPLVFPPGVAPAAAAAAPIVVQTPNGPVPMYPPRAPPRGAPGMPVMVQTPQGPVFMDRPQPQGLPGPADAPWQEWDVKHTAMVALMAGVKLAYNAASSAWEIIQMALDKTAQDNMKARDDYNAHMAALAHFGYRAPRQSLFYPPAPLAPPPHMPPAYAPAIPGAWV